eukprot:GHVP01012470.1.p1 GENE.GHVP01012470.1~~GHVP01012470.1.p1  ORF type:complete len:227 (-),score=29.80 GHVP01012470.1:475-1155(-)
MARSAWTTPFRVRDAPSSSAWAKAAAPALKAQQPNSRVLAQVRLLRADGEHRGAFLPSEVERLLEFDKKAPRRAQVELAQPRPRATVSLASQELLQALAEYGYLGLRYNIPCVLRPRDLHDTFRMFLPPAVGEAYLDSYPEELTVQALQAWLCMWKQAQHLKASSAYPVATGEFREASWKQKTSEDTSATGALDHLMGKKCWVCRGDHFAVDCEKNARPHTGVSPN